MTETSRGHLKITSNGTVAGTFIEVDGRRLGNVRSVTFLADANTPLVAVSLVLHPSSVEIEAENVTIETYPTEES